MPVKKHYRRAAVPAPAPSGRSPLENLRRFLRTPKGTLLWILLCLVVLSMIGTHRHTLPDVIAGVVGAAGADLVLSGVRRGRVAFPSGGVISGLLVAMVLARETPAYVPLLVGAFAVIAKHLLRTRWSNVFNPAVLGLLFCALVFRSGQSWWGALPYAGIAGFAAVLVAGWYMAAKVNKLPLALAFLTASLVGFSVASFFGAGAQVAQVFRAPDINALFFFAAFMLTDPPTSPARHGDQVWFGTVAGAIAVAIFLRFGAQWFILAGLPVANLLESLRRMALRRPGPVMGKGGVAVKS